MLDINVKISWTFISICAPGGNPSKDLAERFFPPQDRLNPNREEQSQQKRGMKSRQALAAS